MENGSGGFPLSNTVLVLGGFDILHWGHAAFLRQAEQYGDVTVGLSTDELLAETKRVPAFTYPERKQALQHLGYKVVRRDTVDIVYLFDKLSPDVFVCGNDWTDRDHLASAGLDVDFLNDHNVTLVYTPRNHAMSSTEILRRVREV